MNYKDKIISVISDRACKSITEKVVRKLQKVKEDLQTGEDYSATKISK